MTKHRAMNQAGLAAAVALALCMTASGSNASVIWGGGRQRLAVDAARARTDARAGWRLSEGSRTAYDTRDGRAGWRLTDARAGWRLDAMIRAARAGW